MAIFLLQFPIGDPIPFYRPVYVESENWPTQAQIVSALEDLHKKILSMTGESYWEDIIEAVKKRYFV